MTIAALDALAETEAGLAADFKAGTITEVQLAEGLAAAYQEAFGGASTPLEAAALAAEAISRLTTFLDEFLGNVGLTIKGTLGASGDLPTSGNAVGDGYLIGGNLWVWTGTPGGWTNAGAVVGPAGPSVELQKSSTHVQWRVVGGSSWNNLIPLADLVGGAGPAIELGTSLTHVRWRVVGTTDWTNLIAIADLRGAPGDPGTNGLDGWTPVFAIVSDGARRVLQISDWVGGEGTKPTTGQYVGPSGLTGTLASAVDLRGPAGANGSGTGDVLAPASHAAGRVPVWAGADSKTLTEGRPIGSGSDDALLDKAAGLALFRTETQVSAAISAAIDALLAGAPGALNTLDELAAALGDDANFATTVTNAIAGKLSKTVSATARVLGRASAGSGDVEELTVAQLKTLLALAAADVSGVLALAGGDMTGRLKLHAFTEKAAGYSSGAIDTATGSVVDAGTISSNVTVSFANLPSSPATGDTVTEVLRATISGTPVITWPSGIVWAANTAPTLAAGAWEFVISARWTGSAWAYRGAWVRFF